MKQTIKQTFIAGMAVALLVPAVASAQGGREGLAQTSNPVSESTEAPADRTTKARQELQAKLDAQKAARQEKVESLRAEANERLDATKRKVCQTRQANINRIMTNMNNRRHNAFERITKISTAVQEFYTKKQLTVDNYDELLATLTAAQAAAQESMNAQESVPKLDCDGDRPKTSVANFKEKRSDSIDAMKAYRDAVKAFTEAVRTTARTAEGAQ